MEQELQSLPDNSEAGLMKQISKLHHLYRPGNKGSHKLMNARVYFERAGKTGEGKTGKNLLSRFEFLR